MLPEFQLFDAASGDLDRGITLVEASAGTGKTYAITMLVLRAVVELKIPLTKILVVTFTKAATEELRLRIRARLVGARDILLGLVPDCDPTFAAWAQRIDDKAEATARLQLALADLDQAAIFTIHGFCQRVLAEQALESGQLFEIELLGDIAEIRQQIAEDFWRRQLYPLGLLPCSLVIEKFATPEKLLQSVRESWRTDCLLEPASPPVEKLIARLEPALDNLARWWQDNNGRLERLFVEHLGNDIFKKSFSDDFSLWWQELDGFFVGRSARLPEHLEWLTVHGLAEQLNGNKIRGEEKRLALLSTWHLPDEEVALVQTVADAFIIALRRELAEMLRREIGVRLERQGTIGFDGLLTKLAAALAGPHCEILQTTISARYALVLVDEFQDTDATQWQIFSRLFGDTRQRLYLIGDPKQAIYKFRGADIYSYFQARQAATHCLTLQQNYRSHPYLIAEVNRLFCERKKPFFFDEEMLAYRPIAAAKTAEELGLSIRGQNFAGMVYCTLEPTPEKDGRWSSTKAGKRILAFTVKEIVRLCRQESAILLKLDAERPLLPRDIAILVRSHKQAEEYREALLAAGVPATLGSRQSVFHTTECWELMLLMQAIADPGNLLAVRTALTVRWFGFDGWDLYSLFNDGERFNEIHSRFLFYHELWRDRGFLVMMHQMLAAEDVLPTLAQGKLAERAITNISHLLELIEEKASAGNLGINQIVQWLESQREEGGEESSELQLETDEEAVRIITMHGAKGLEFPVVFCPVLWHRHDWLKDEKLQVSCHTEDGLVVDLGSNQFKDRRAQAAVEQMAEDLRLLYVALTRAKCRCYVMWADVKPRGGLCDAFQSALGYLLFPEGNCSHQKQQERLAALAKEGTVHLLSMLPDEESPKYRGLVEATVLQPLLPSERTLTTDRQITSYSALAMLSDFEDLPKVSEDEAGVAITVPGLPAGAGFGSIVHALLDRLPFAELAADLGAHIGHLPQLCSRFGVQVDPLAIGKLLQQITATPLISPCGEGPFALAGVDGQCFKEMGFYYRVGRLTLEKINSILAEEQAFTPLSQRRMQGFLTGFMDLVCRVGERYYILDYKTNYLGDYRQDYRPEKLVEAMRTHNYGLQYWLYSVVLHRHLERMHAGYEYHRNFGGVMYLFVRGMDAKTPGSGVYSILPEYKKVLALDQAIGGNTDA